MNASWLLARSSDCRSGLPAVGERPLDSLEGSAVSSRYRAWRGLSGQRYVASVFPVDPRAADRGLSVFEGFVLLAAVRDRRGLRALEILAIETDAGRERAVASAMARGVTEWHVHFLAEGCGRRRAVVADLRAAHERSARAPLSA